MGYCEYVSTASHFIFRNTVLVELSLFTDDWSFPSDGFQFTVQVGTPVDSWAPWIILHQCVLNIYRNSENNITLFMTNIDHNLNLTSIL